MPAPEPGALVVSTADGIADVARQAMLRPEPARFAPVACRDVDGAPAGIVRVERLVEALAHAADRDAALADER